MSVSLLIDYSRACFIKSAIDIHSLPKDTGAEVAFIGRSNVGKSSTINGITHRGLARVSKTPGRTQLMNVFSLDKDGEYRLVDLPGYGYAKVPLQVRAQWPERINTYLQCRQSLRGLVLVMDIRHPLRPSDRQVVEWCTLARLPVRILLNKTDKISRGAAINTQRQQEKNLVDSFSIAFQDKKKPLVSFQLFSSKSGQGLTELQTFLIEWLA